MGGEQGSVQDAGLDDEPVREVVLGHGSLVWRTLARDPAFAARFGATLGHRELAQFAFTAHDRVWVFAYARKPAQNDALLARLRAAGVREVIYVSSSSTIVARVTHCYAYPRAKLLAETRALQLPNARVLTLGLMHTQPRELPAGANIATSYAQLAAFMSAPQWPLADPRRKPLFSIVHRPFGGAIERAAYRAYGALLARAGSRPCWLRPLDVLLRLAGRRWYGYTHLSNRLWISTMS